MENQGPALNRRLSSVDAAFLYLERKEIPLNVACVCVFEDVLPYEEFVTALDSKLDLIPRYRQVVSEPPFYLGYPTWNWDPHFDIRRHVLRTKLPAPGGEAELEALAGAVFSSVLDRSRPLWEIHVVEGLKDGRGALILRVHHALADGIAGASLLRVMLDPTPHGSRAIRKPRQRSPRPAPEPTLSESIGGAITTTLQNLVVAEAGLLALGQSLLNGNMQTSLQGLAPILPELAAPVERLPFNR